MRFPRTLGGLAAVALAVAFALPPDAPRSTHAASHREAPLISLDPAADISDFFMFRSYEAGKSDNVILMMNVFPGEEPSSGPNYFLFDPNVRYAFNIDNDRDGVADDVVFELQFSTEVRGVVDDLDLFLGYLGNIDGVPPITTLDGPGSEGLGLRQKYTVTMTTKKGHREVLATGLIAVPANVGKKTMGTIAASTYDALAAQGIFSVGHGIRVFAGQRQDPFYIDLGGIFDTLNLRRTPPLLTAAEDANDNVNPFGEDMLSGFNVNTIALEVPASLLTTDGNGPSVTTQPKLGAYASTSRRHTRVLRVDRTDGDIVKTSGRWIQVQRLANPLVNEAIIGTEDKDEWNATEPEDESRFVDYYLNPRLALALQLAYGVPAGTSGRTDLRDLLLTYAPGDRLSELLRLDVSVPPTAPLATQRRMGPLAVTPDPAAWPNGRRPKDDVTDIAVRVVGGPNYIAARAGDGVNHDDATETDAFPFLATPSDGRDRVHHNAPTP